MPTNDDSAESPKLPGLKPGQRVRLLKTVDGAPGNGFKEGDVLVVADGPIIRGSPYVAVSNGDWSTALHRDELEVLSVRGLLDDLFDQAKAEQVKLDQARRVLDDELNAACGLVILDHVRSVLPRIGSFCAPHCTPLMRHVSTGGPGEPVFPELGKARWEFRYINTLRVWTARLDIKHSRKDGSRVDTADATRPTLRGAVLKMLERTGTWNRNERSREPERTHALDMLRADLKDTATGAAWWEE